jgi:hypothetical protein
VPDLKGGKVKNVQTGSQAAPAITPVLNVGAKPFHFNAFPPAPAATAAPVAPVAPVVPVAPPAPVVPADPVGDKLKKLGVTDVEEVKTFKTLLVDLKKSFDDNKDGVISMDLFKKMGELKICQTQETKVSEDCLKSSCNPLLVEREVKDRLEGITKMKKNYNQHNKGPNKGGYQNYNNGAGQDNDFAKGTVK